MARNDGIVARVCGAIFRYLTGLDLRAVVDEQVRLSGRIDELREAPRAEIEAILAWIRGAEAHLASLQAGYESHSLRIDSVDGAHRADVNAVLAWMRGAEEHLAALQGDHERLGALSQHHRLLARVTLLETSLRDLERADTAIAAALATASIPDRLS